MEKKVRVRPSMEVRTSTGVKVYVTHDNLKNIYKAVVDNKDGFTKDLFSSVCNEVGFDEIIPFDDIIEIGCLLMLRAIRDQRPTSEVEAMAMPYIKDQGWGVEEKYLAQLYDTLNKDRVKYLRFLLMDLYEDHDSIQYDANIDEIISAGFAVLSRVFSVPKWRG